jgi:hypothetical protein
LSQSNLIFPITHPTTATSYDANGIALLRPLAAGEPLWPEMIEQAADARPKLEASAAAAVAAAAEAASSAPAAAAPQEHTAAASEPAATGSASGVDLPAQAQPTAAQQQQQPERLVAVVFGPPMAGTSTQARLLGSRYGVPVVTLDGLVEVRSIAVHWTMDVVLQLFVLSGFSLNIEKHCLVPQINRRRQRCSPRLNSQQRSQPSQLQAVSKATLLQQQ